MTPLERADCNHRVLSDLVAFNETEIYPRLFDLHNDARQRAIVTCYRRLHYWALSLRTLDRIEHFQAVSAGVRSMFEILVDLLWFETHPEPEWVAMYHAFVFVDTYRVANDVCDFEREQQATSDPHYPSPSADHLKDIDPAKLAEAKKLWSGDLLDVRHWTGHGRLKQRIKYLAQQAPATGKEVEELRVKVYPILCADIHSGPTAIVGMPQAQIVQKIADCYFYAFVFMDSGAQTACSLLGVSAAIPDLSQKMDELRGRLRLK